MRDRPSSAAPDSSRRRPGSNPPASAARVVAIPSAWCTSVARAGRFHTGSPRSSLAAAPTCNAMGRCSTPSR